MQDASGLAREIAYATAAVALAVAGAAIAERALAFSDLSLVFITATLFVATRARMAVAMYAAFASFLAYNFFFIAPRYTLYIGSGQGVTTVLLFLLAALICGRLANRLRSQVLALRAAQAAGAELKHQAEIERLRAALLASVSHDLRTPLSTIIGAAESLSAYRGRLGDEDQRALAEEILQEGQRLDRHIQNLLDMTRLGQGAPAPEREWLGLDELCGDALLRARRVHPAVELRARLPDPAPLVHLSPGLMEQALFNVLDNAAKFSPAGAPVELTARANGEWLAIEVTDRGPGIPLEERERVFDMFHSVRRDDHAPGTGLGLTISRGIVRAHGGSIDARDGSGGRGCTIHIELPLSPPPDDTAGED
jgi:K+-sensing histidine kinase KdpD